jgi:transcriptional regulator with XRE-family HTH domain
MSTVHLPPTPVVETKRSQYSIIVQKNLNFLMERNGIDVHTLSTDLGFAVSTISVIRRGIGNPTLATLESIANYFKVSVSDFVSKNLTAGIEPALHELPLVSFNLLDAYLQKIFTPSDYYRVELEDACYPSEMFAITVDRNGLAPFWEKGSVLIVDRTIQARDMDIVVVKFGEHVPCIRKALINGDSSYIFSKLIADNAELNAQPNTYCIIGVVIKIIINFDGK